MKYDGGPAFPRPGSTWNEEGYQYSAGSNWGMTLRDYFAGQALKGLTAQYKLNAPGDQITLAQMSYELADAMIAERDK